MRNRIEEIIQLVNRLGDSMAKRPLQALAQSIPIRFPLQNKGVHPAVALAEHLDELVFEVMPVVIAPEQQIFNRKAQRCLVSTDLLQCAPCCAAVEFCRLS